MCRKQTAITRRSEEIRDSYVAKWYRGTSGTVFSLVNLGTGVSEAKYCV